jgi:hypothetical protein
MNKGVQSVLDSVIDYLPSPLDIAAVPAMGLLTVLPENALFQRHPIYMHFHWTQLLEASMIISTPFQVL